MFSYFNMNVRVPLTLVHCFVLDRSQAVISGTYMSVCGANSIVNCCLDSDLSPPSTLSVWGSTFFLVSCLFSTYICLYFVLFQFELIGFSYRCTFLLAVDFFRIFTIC